MLVSPIGGERREERRKEREGKQRELTLLFARVFTGFRLEGYCSSLKKSIFAGISNTQPVLVPSSFSSVFPPPSSFFPSNLHHVYCREAL